MKRFPPPNLHGRASIPEPRVRPEPPCRHIWQNANDRVRRPIERDAPPNHIRIASEAFLPEIFRHQCDIGASLFFRQKIAAKNWANDKHIEIVGGQSVAKYLDRIAKSGQCERNEILRSETVKNRLTVAIKLVTRGRYSDIRQIARFVAVVEMNNARRFLERQPAQKQIVDQTKDRGVQPDPERQCDDRNRRERRRFAELAQSKL